MFLVDCANNSTNNPTAAAASHMVYTGSLPSAVSPAMESVKKKRGRPRKYSTPEQAAAAKRLSSASAPPKKRDHGLSSAAGAVGAGSSSKKSQLAALGNAGQAFTPHIINVSTGERLSLLLSMKACLNQKKKKTYLSKKVDDKRNLAIPNRDSKLSLASLFYVKGSSLPAMRECIFKRGDLTFLTLSGSYVRTEIGGRTGGLSILLSGNADGQIVEVIVGSFSVDSKTGGLKHDTSPQFGGSPISSVGFRSVVDSSNQSMGGDQKLLPNSLMCGPQNFFCIALDYLAVFVF
ncbi:hypothetical protein HAX54_007934 [Datura stramonium]|uniref:AT-hook motif nuclear-localized protein n=1 Tax=Datura stramonium TaxID=4076 RepID=A0ABS8WY45_DATST|nr:hypothetical protein [Datura stramonium]